MKWTKIKPDSNGGYNVFENWTLSDDVLSRILPFLLMIPVIILFGLILPGILWLLISMEDRKANIEHIYVAIGASVLFFLDYCLGGLMWCFFHSTESETTLHFFAILHVIFLIGNIIRYKYYKSEIEIPPIILFASLIFIMYFGYNILNSIVKLMCSNTPMSWFAEMFYEDVKNYKIRNH